MSSTLESEYITLNNLTLERLANLSGSLHQNFLFLEKTLKITIKYTQNKLILNSLSPLNLKLAKKVVNYLYQLADNPISIEIVQAIVHDEDLTLSNTPLKLSRKFILPRNSKQMTYIESMDKKDIVFAVGPAGTGKTYLAVSKAIEQFEKGEVQRLIFVRPAVEAGEKLGFLPGDLVEKVLPYLRPIYDALYEMIGFKEAQKLIQSDVIEILPLAFMRGRTLNEAFIILDEAQNTTLLQMKMFLTRMGFGSRAVITGDMTQVDLPRGIESGLAHALKILNRIDEIGIHYFTSNEVVRHPLITKIVDCYDIPKKDKNND